MGLYTIFSLYGIGIIAYLLRIAQRVLSPPCRPTIREPYRQVVRRNLLSLDIMVAIVLLVWAISVSFVVLALTNTLNSNIAFPVVWILSTTVIWLAKVYQLLFFQGLLSYSPVLALSAVLTVQTYAVSLIIFSLTSHIACGMICYILLLYSRLS